MINDLGKDLEISGKKEIRNAYFREEKRDYCLMIPTYGSYNDALLLNKQGKIIIEALIGKETTANKVIQLMQSHYPEAEQELIEKDVYAFLSTLHSANLIKVKGAEEMYKGRVISEIEGYAVYRCLEGDLKEVNAVLKTKDPYVSFQYTDTYGGVYNPIYTRSRVFSFVEEFYFLKDNTGEPQAMLSIMHGRGVFNEIPLIGIYIQKNEMPTSCIEKFVKECLCNFKKEVEQEAARVRIKMPIMDNRQAVMLDVFQSAGFKKLVVLENELGLDRDAALLDYLY